jgi:septal ring factor EnvC (AmiA/AmiB activator)
MRRPLPLSLRLPLVLVFVLAAHAAPARAQGATRQERTDVQKRLATEKAALELIRNQKVSALEVLDLVEHLSRRSRQRAQQVEEELRLLQRRLALAERQEAVANLALEQQLKRLAPRLLVMYRTKRKNPLDVLLSARDFAGLVWRSRALSALVESDLRLLRDVQRVRRFQALSHRQLEGLKLELAGRLESARAQQLRAERQRTELADLLSLLQAEAVRSGRAVRELEQADRELGLLIAEMEAAPALSGFGSLKGKLPWPVAGQVEAGFGKVVNPKFNTVTVRKGLDVRAPAGTPVTAVADGKVAYAGWLRGYGNVAIVDHGDGYHTVLAHLAELKVRAGELVLAGQPVGPVGDTGSLKGAYLYFEVRHHGMAVDPQVWLGR